jgi:hypothetical protein
MTFSAESSVEAAGNRDDLQFFLLIYTNSLPLDPQIQLTTTRSNAAIVHSCIIIRYFHVHQLDVVVQLDVSIEVWRF